jgi:hypothetical protein
MNQNQYLVYEILPKFFDKDANLIGVEIGVLGASGSLAIFTELPNTKLYGIDPYEIREGNRYEAGSYPQEHLDINYKQAKARFESFGNRGVLLKKRSDDAIEDVTEALDFVWIDGDHEYEQVKRDILNWKSKLKSKAIIGGHDWQNDEVRQAVLEVFKEEEIKLGDDFTWWREYV